VRWRALSTRSGPGRGCGQRAGGCGLRVGPGWAATGAARSKARGVVGAVGVEVEGVVGTEVGGDVGALISLLLWSLLLAAPIVLH